MFGNQKIFVSHTHEDNQRCQPLLAALDAWQLDYWFDLQELGAGQRFSDRIEQELGDRDILIRVGTTAATHSFWMNRELRAVRGVQAAMPQRPRLIIHLILTPEYVVDAVVAREEVVIDTTKSPRVTWLHALHQALGLTPTASTSQRVGRRAAIGIGALSLAALATTGTAAALYLKHLPIAKATRFAPTGLASTATPQPGVEHLRWQFNTALDDRILTKVYVASDATNVYAFNNNTIAVIVLNVSDGKLVSRYPASNLDFIGNGYSITVSVDTAYITADYYTGASGKSAFQIIAFDKTNSTEKWRTTLGNRSVFTSKICVTANALYLQYRNQLLAFGLDGKSLWPAVTLAPIDTLDTPFQRSISAPTYANGIVYVGNANGKLYAVDATKGSIRWIAQVTPASLTDTVDKTSENASMVETDIVAANGFVFVGANDGQLRAFDAITGAPRWNTQIVPLTLIDTLEPIGTALVADGVLYLSAGKHSQLFAVDATNGKILWTLDPIQALNLQNLTAAPNANVPVIQGATAYFPVAFLPTIKNNTMLGTNTLLAVNKSTGAMQWHYDIDLNNLFSFSENNPAVSLIAPSGVVLASSDGKITVLNT